MSFRARLSVLTASTFAVLAAFVLVPTAESQRGGPCRGGQELLQAPPQPEVDARIAVCSTPPSSRTARSQSVEVLTVKYRTGARGAFDTVFQLQYRPGGTPTARYEMVRADATGVRGRVTVEYPATGETESGVTGPQRLSLDLTFPFGFARVTQVQQTAAR